MAPDLNLLANFATDGYASNQVPRKQYEIPDIVMGAPTIRKIRILSIGCGLSGVMNAYRIQKELENVEHVMYEKNQDIGGTWLENRYPGCACDIPSHAYTMPFALNPDWPRFFSYAPDIWSYLDKICEVWQLRKYMNFNSEVINCEWHQESGQWNVKVKQTQSDGSTKLINDHCHVLLHGTGLLNNFKWPNIDGLDKFKGKIIHTARWPENYQEEQWKEDRVAVIGSGASSIQTVPTMQPHAKHIDVFVRTGVWFVEIADNYGQNHAYTDEQRQSFHTDASELVAHAKSLENKVNGLWGAFYKNSEKQAAAQKLLKERMGEWIKDERLLEGFTPKFGVGCRRITPGDPYMSAIQKPNIDVHFTAVNHLTEKGVVGEDGVEREVDTVVCATGFDVSYRPRFPIIGQCGVDLADKWKKCPEGYMGLMIPGFPNFITFVGPTFPVENGSVTGPLWQVSDYTIQMVKKIQSEYICSITPKQDVTDQFNDHSQEWVRHTIWTDSCRSWYKDNETGRVNAVWPGSSLHYIEAIQTPRYEDFDIEYLDQAKNNRFAYLGMGYTRALVGNGDPSPYLTVEGIDSDWAKAKGINRKKTIEAKIRALQKQLEIEEENEKDADSKDVNIGPLTVE